MSQRDRRAVLRAVQAATGDAEGKLGVAAELPSPAPPPTPEPVVAAPAAEPAAECQPALEPAARPAAARPSRARGGSSLEDLLPADLRARVDSAQVAEAVEVHGERVRRRVDEETVYLAVRVPRSLRDAIRQRAERLDISVQEFVTQAAGLLLAATSRAAEREAD